MLSRAKAGLGSVKDHLLQQSGLQAAPKHPLAIVVPPMPQGTSWLEVDAPDGQVIRLPLPEAVLQGSTIYVEYIPRAHAGGVAADPTQPPVVQARPILRPPDGMAEQAAVALFKSLDDFKKSIPSSSGCWRLLANDRRPSLCHICLRVSPISTILRARELHCVASSFLDLWPFSKGQSRPGPCVRAVHFSSFALSTRRCWKKSLFQTSTSRRHGIVCLAEVVRQCSPLKAECWEQSYRSSRGSEPGGGCWGRALHSVRLTFVDAV